MNAARPLQQDYFVRLGWNFYGAVCCGENFLPLQDTPVGAIRQLLPLVSCQAVHAVFKHPMGKNRYAVRG